MRFTVQAPDGRRITLEGDKAPTEQELNTIFGYSGNQPEMPKLDAVNNQSNQSAENKDYTLGRIGTVDRGVTFGLGRKLGGLVNAIGSYPVDRAAEALGVENTPRFMDRYHEIVDPTIQAIDEYHKDKPVEATTLELGSSLLNPANKFGVGYIAKGGSLANKAARSIGVGGVIGGLASAGNTENVDDLGQNIASGSGIGATIGGALPVAGSALKLSRNGLQQILGKTTGAGDKAIADAFTAGTQGNKSFLRKMAESIDAEGLEKKVENNFNKIKQNRNRAYEEDITRLKLQTADKKLDIKPVIEDIRAIMRKEGGGADYLVDDDTAQVLSKTKDTINKFYKDTSRHNLEGFDNLKKKLQDIVKTKEGTNADRVKTQIANSVKGQILKQSPEYKTIQDNYAKDSEILNDLKKVFSLNRNANSETILRKVQSTARNNANTDWSYRAQLLKQLDPTGEIQQEISANALNTWAPRGGLAGLVGAGGLYAHNPFMIAMSSPRLAGYASYGVGRVAGKFPDANISPYLAEYIANNQ